MEIAHGTRARSWGLSEMLNNQLIGPEGVQLGHRTIDEIGRQLLAVSPQNYEVWLTYMTHSSPDLRAAVDKLIASGNPITADDMEQLYERFFSTTHLSTQVMETGTRIAHEIADALDALKKAGATTERYGATLNVAADSLQNATIDGDAISVTGQAGPDLIDRLAHTAALGATPEVKGTARWVIRARAGRLFSEATEPSCRARLAHCGGRSPRWPHPGGRSALV